MDEEDAMCGYDAGGVFKRTCAGLLLAVGLAAPAGSQPAPLDPKLRQVLIDVVLYQTSMTREEIVAFARDRMRSPDPRVREVALTIVGARAGGGPRLTTDEEVHAMWPADHAALQVLRGDVLEALGDSSPDVRRQALRAIVQLDTPAEIVLLRLRPDTQSRVLTLYEEDTDSPIRVSALEMIALSRLEQGDLRDLLFRAAVDPDPSVRHSAAGLLGNVDATVALPQLLRMLADPDAGVRLSAATTFHRFGPAVGEHLQALEEALAGQTDKRVHDELRRVIDNLRRIA